MRFVNIFLAIVTICAPICKAAPAPIIDALRWEESRGDPRAIGHNRDGSHDLGPYQINDRYLSWYGMKYLGRASFDPFGGEARIVASRHLIYLCRFLSTGPQDCGITRRMAVRGALAAYNCGLARYLRGAPASSLAYADSILRRAGICFASGI